MSISNAQVNEGQILGRYELLLPIAQGGMARIWVARLHGTRGFRKLVAVKTMLCGVVDGERLEKMLQEEAQLAAEIHHPNVAGTIELDEQDGVLYLVMEWVDGESLHYLMQKSESQGGIPLPIAVNLIKQACKGLHAAHNLQDEHGTQIGLVHRDVSPHNVLVSYSGIVKLVDFGIAKATQRSQALTEAGELKGKLAYMAPEQILGHDVDRRADIFSLGTILYLITAGRHPFKGDHPGATLQNVCSKEPAVPPSAFLDDYPPGLESVVLKALAKNPDERWSTCREMLEALEAAVPDSLEAGVEVRVAEYISRIAGDRGVERRKQIRLAGELLDRRRLLQPGMGEPGSQSSLRAFSIDRSGTSSGLQRVRLENEPSVTQVVPETPPRRRPLRTALAVAGGLAVLGVAAFTFVGSPREHAKASAGGSPVPVDANVKAAKEAEATRLSEAAASANAPPSAAGSSRLAAPGSATAKSATTEPAAPAAVPARRWVANPGAAPRIAAADAPAASAAPSNSATARPSPPKASASAPAGAVDIWDQKTLGGRH